MPYRIFPAAVSQYQHCHHKSLSKGIGNFLNGMVPHAARPLASRGAVVLSLARRPSTSRKNAPMPKTIEHVHWPDAPNLWMPYAPAIKVRGGTTVYLAGVTAAPVYHHHPHRPEEFDAMPSDMEGQARAALENLQRGLKAVGANFADIVTADRFVTDLSDQDALNRVWAEYFGEAKPTTTTVQVVRLATDPRCLVEINAIAVID
jgi:enamine deaminase RidA (YjgF/YER057c/UK114 family)